MKPKPDFETPFEESLADFERAPLPADWKADLIDNALSEAKACQVPRSSPFTKVVIGTLAACWIAIGVLRIMTPSDSRAAADQIVHQRVNPAESLPLLVQYFETRRSLNLNF